MKHTYAQPAMQEMELDPAYTLLAGTNIGEGGEGQQGDVKGFGSIKDSNQGSVFDDNPFE